MKARILFIFIIILLVAANGIAFLKARQKQSKLERAHQLLANDSTMATHLRYVWRVHRSGLIAYAEVDDQATRDACNSLIGLMKAVEALERFYRTVGYSNSQDFFSGSIAVDVALRDSLYTSYERFDIAMRKWYADTLSAPHQEALKTARATYQSMLAKMKPLAPGNMKMFVFPLDFPGEERVEINVTAVRTSGSVVWNDEGEKIPAYLRNLDFFTYQSRLNVHQSLAIFRQTLGVRDQAKIFNDVYDLTDLSPGQLRAIVNHLKFMITAINADLVEPVKFYDDEG